MVVVRGRVKTPSHRVLSFYAQNCKCETLIMAWSLAVTIGKTEFAAAERLRLLGLEIFCPYTVERSRVKVRQPHTRARTVFKVVDTKIPRWPRYLFCKTEDLGALQSDRDISYIVRGAEGEPCMLSDYMMSEIQRDCDASGRVLVRSSLHSFSVGDLLRFVGGSSFAGHSGEVLSIEANGVLSVLVSGHAKVKVDFKDLAA